MNQLKGSLLVGGGDDMIALRCYPADDGTVLCDLYAPANGSIYTGCPTLLGLTIPAPSSEWTGDGLDDRPVVFAVYRSSQGNSRKTPVVVGVLANQYLKYTTQQKAQNATGNTSAQAPPEPTVRDAVVATDGARLLLRDGGSAQLVANDVFLHAGSLRVNDGGDDSQDQPVLATPMQAELVRISEQINGITEYLQRLTIATELGPAPPVDPFTGVGYRPPQVTDIQSRSVYLPNTLAATGDSGAEPVEEITNGPA